MSGKRNESDLGEGEGVWIVLSSEVTLIVVSKTFNYFSVILLPIKMFVSD